MWRGVYLSIVLCFVCLVSAYPQVKVDPASIKADFADNLLKTSFVFENSVSTEAEVELEILDKNDDLTATSNTRHTLRSGRQTIQIPIQLGEKQQNNDDLLWQRLRYTITRTGEGQVILSDVVSLSEIMPEIFELRTAISDKIVAGVKLRAHVEAFHPFTKRPIKEVAINGDLTIELDTENDEDELKLTAKGTTDGNGYVVLDFDVPGGIKIDDSTLVIKGTKNRIEREFEQDIEPHEGAYVYLNTDKPLYQPGQKLFIRGLYLDPMQLPLKDEELEITIEDEDYEDVYQQTIKTSRFGIASTGWQLPDNLKLGRYRIEVENSDGDEVGRAEFKVSRYDLPQFTVRTKTDREFYLPDQRMAEIKVNADYLFGKPVTRGRVRVVQEKERRWNYKEQKYETEEGMVQEGETDAQGNFAARFDLGNELKDLDDRSWKRSEDLKFTAYFTDLTTNRTEQKRFDLRLSKEPIHLYFIRYDSSINPTLPFQFYVSAFYANGEPAKCKLAISGNYQKESVMHDLTRGNTNRFGAAKMRFQFPDRATPASGSRFELKITATDGDGQKGTFEDDVYLDEEDQQIRIDTAKAIYAPGETVEATITATSRQGYVFVDLVKGLGIITSQRVKLSKGKASIRFPYRPTHRGEIVLSAYYRDAEDEETIRYSKPLMFPESKNMNVGVKSSQKTYRPGQEATVSFKADKDSALGVVVFDKAIEERVRTDRDFGGDTRLLSGFDRLLGLSESFGGLTRNDLDNLDTTKPVDADLQLAAEFLLLGSSYYPRIYESESYTESFSSEYRDYFSKRLAPVTTALNKTYDETGEYPADMPSLRQILVNGGIDTDALRDAWNTPYRFVFSNYQNSISLSITTAGADKKYDTPDDYPVNTLRFNWFKKTQLKLEQIIEEQKKTGQPMPKNITAIKEVWKHSGVDFDSLRDAAGRSLYLNEYTYSRSSQKVWTETVGNYNEEKKEVTYATPVTEEVIQFSVKSTGEDGVTSNDDFILASFIVVVAQKEISTKRSDVKITEIASRGSNGAIGGVVTDPNGAVIPGAVILIKNQDTAQAVSITTDENGEYLIKDLPSGLYTVTAEAPGFRRATVNNVVVRAMNLIQLDLALQIGGVMMTVDVTSGADSVINTSSASISNTVTRSKRSSIAEALGNGKEQIATPRLREYFPETLVWQPELLTDKKGRAELKFKMADSLTTWKLYTIGSSLSGKLGVSELEIKTFQPFFVDLDPPKVLTEGDEISLPSQIRNYTDKAQRVSVTMANADWFESLGPLSREVSVAPNRTENSVFTFRAKTSVLAGKQRVTALSGDDSDAIEKPVRVVPNGQEVVRTQSDLFRNRSSLKLDFPANALPNTRRAELKLYPNLYSHIAESVEGLLKRPYGCGEQTISSTYPNLLILKFAAGNKDSIPAKTRKQAEDFLLDGYKRLLGYQTADGGFAYWKNDKPDLALTAYALRFLGDAKEHIEIDKEVLNRAVKWLLGQQEKDGSWSKSYSGSTDRSRVRSFTAYTANVLASMSVSKEGTESAKRAIGFLKNDEALHLEAYPLANFILAARALDDKTAAMSGIEKLSALAKREGKLVYWDLSGTTPFYSWGLPGRLETTAVAILALSNGEEAARKLAGDSTLFLLKNKDRYGVWHSTQTTINVLNALISQIPKDSAPAANNAELFINGAKVRDIPLPSVNGFTAPIVVDMSEKLALENSIEIRLPGDSPTMAQIVATHYVDWKDAELNDRSGTLGLTYSCDKTSVAIMESVKCSVAITSKKYGGMFLAEIGLPPGAEVDRESLETARKNWTISRYDVLPDKIIVYTWGDSKREVNFTFKPRYGINAQTAPSTVYDYYNPEAQAVVAPMRFVVK